jgi:hypothetical protein
VGAGNRLEEVIFTNIGRHPCVLRGYPTVTSGQRVVHALLGGTYFGRLVPAVIGPGEHGFLDFGTANHTDCGAGPPTSRYHGLVFTLPQGGRVRAPGVSIIEHCSFSISELGRPEPPR